MQENLSLAINQIKSEFGECHAHLYKLIANDDQVMSTYGLECATGLDSDTMAGYLGDLVRNSYIRVYEKHGRRPAWEIVKDVAIAS